MSIMIICTDIYKIAGGIQRFNRLLSQAIADIYTPKELYIYSLLDNLQSKSQQPVNELRCKRFNSFNHNKLAFTMRILYDALITQPKLIVITHIHLSPIAWILRTFIRSLNLIVVLHGFEAWTSVKPFRLRGIKACDKLISVSQYTKHLFCKFNSYDETKVEVVHLALDPSFSLEESVGKDQERPLKFPYILCVSRLEPEHGQYKGVDNLIRAVGVLRKNGQLGEYHLVVIGEGNDRTRLEKIVIEANLSDRVIFTGRISEDNLKRYYQFCDIFALPSKKEGFGLVFLEAMAFSKPVIAGNYGACGEIVVDKETGFLVSYDNIDQLSFKLNQLISNDSLRINMGNNGRRRLEAEFTYPSFIHRLKCVI